MRRRRMGAMNMIAVDPYLSQLQTSKVEGHQIISRVVVVEEIQGLLKVYKDGRVERPQIVPCVGCSSSLPPELELELELGVTCRDKVIDKSTNVWARFYVPNHGNGKMPLLVYFHGGGFCVGSAAWSCYHEFLASLASRAGCVIMSVNYRLAPENPLPAAYEDGLTAVMWVKQQQQLQQDVSGWSRKCNFSRVFLGGDSAGGNIAYNVGIRLTSCNGRCGLGFKGNILIQPFFGGEARTNSEKYMIQEARSALTMAASDTYWRLSLPSGTNRDHPWCNVPGSIKKKTGELSRLPTMVCISELDILRDRNLEFCEALGSTAVGVVYKGVGHAFHVVNKSPISQITTHEMISHIKDFLQSH